MTWKVEADSLTEEDIQTAAYLIRSCYKFGRVIGIPRGGLRLSEALEPYVSDLCSRTLIVDDVMTTGKSFLDAHEQYAPHPGEVVGIAIFARGNPHISWIRPLWVLGEEFSEIK